MEPRLYVRSFEYWGHYCFTGKFFCWKSLAVNKQGIL